MCKRTQLGVQKERLEIKGEQKMLLAVELQRVQPGEDLKIWTILFMYLDEMMSKGRS